MQSPLTSADVVNLLLCNARDIADFLDHEKLMKYAIDTKNKQLFLFINEKFNHHYWSEQFQFIDAMFCLFSEPYEIIEIADKCRKKIDKKYRDNFIKNVIIHFHKEYTRWQRKWNLFISYYARTIAKHYNCDDNPGNDLMIFLSVILLYKGYKRMSTFIHTIKTSTEFNGIINEILSHSTISSLLRIPKDKVIEASKDVSIDYHMECRNIVYLKYILKYSNLSHLNSVRFTFGGIFTIKNRYIIIKTMKDVWMYDEYQSFIEISGGDNYGDLDPRDIHLINGELFYHQHRRDKSHLNKILSKIFDTHIKMIHDMFSLVMSKFTSKNLTRLMGYYM